MTERNIIAVDYPTPEPDVVRRAVKVLQDGGLVVAPTETRYGLLGRADQPEVMRKVYAVKKRRADQATAVFVGHVETIRQYARFNRIAQQLAKHFLPGPLTLILSVLPQLDSPVAHEGKIGIRVSSAPVIQMITEETVFPLTATSANLSGSPEPGSISEISQALGESIDLYLDSGVLTGLPSTVVDCTVEPPQILRHGDIEQKEIRAVLESQSV
ncbi:MAG: L-threonylcarbamoyladenylate synthase [Candidatus Zixiibacteriota bacterium]